MAHLHFFDDALSELVGDRQLETHQYMQRFARYLVSVTEEPIGIRLDGQTAEVLFGDTGYGVVAKLRTTLRSACGCIVSRMALMREATSESVKKTTREKRRRHLQELRIETFFAAAMLLRSLW